MKKSKSVNFKHLGKAKSQTSAHVNNRWHGMNPPKTQNVELLWTRNATFVVGTGLSLYYNSYSVNNWYAISPATATQPNFYDFWTTLYDRYVCTSASLQVTLTNPGAFSLTMGILGLPDNTVVPANLQQAREYPLSKFVLVNSTGNVNTATLSAQFDFKELMSRKNQPFPLEYLLSYRNPSSSSALYPIYYYVVLAATDGALAPSSVTCPFTVRLKVSGYFTDRVDSYPSLWRSAQAEEDEDGESVDYLPAVAKTQDPGHH